MEAKFEVGQYVFNNYHSWSSIVGKIESMYLDDYKKMYYYNLKGIEESQPENQLEIHLELNELLWQKK